MSNIKQQIISLLEYKQGYNIWKEGIIISSSGCQIGSLLYFIKEEENFSKKM